MSSVSMFVYTRFGPKGHFLRRDCTTVGLQMIYAITYLRLRSNRADNAFSADALFGMHRG